MRVLVTGARGMLGSDVVRVFAGRHHVTGTDIQDFDIADLDATLRAFKAADPDLVVHCAAWSDVDGAEAEGDATFLANAIGARNAALASNDTGARLLHVSTDYVFDGTADRPYIESDSPNPLGVYARSKWMGEVFVRETCRDWAIVRTQALYAAHGRSFLKAILARRETGEPLSVVNDQTVCPTRTVDLADTLLRIAEQGTPGTYHASGNGACTWFEFAEEILRAVGDPDYPLRPIATADLDLPAPRPPASVLRNLHLQLTIGDTLPHWRDALATYFQEESKT